MVYFAIGLCGPSLKSRSTALAALGFSFFIETTQLYHPPWLDQIRSARLGHLILGSTFNPPDFLAYLVGVLLAWIIDFGSRAGESRGEP